MPRLDMIGLVCRDMGASTDFYRLLGVDAPVPGEEKYVEATLPGVIRLSWNDLGMMKEIAPHWEEPRGQRLGIAFLCDSPAEVDRVYQSVLAAGHKGVKEPWDAFWGQRYAIVQDPDGNHVDLFAPLG